MEERTPLGAELKRIRENTGMSQKAFVRRYREKLEIHHDSTLSRYEKGTVTAPQEVIQKYIEEFNSLILTSMLQVKPLVIESNSRNIEIERQDDGTYVIDELVILEIPHLPSYLVAYCHGDVEARDVQDAIPTVFSVTTLKALQDFEEGLSDVTTELPKFRVRVGPRFVDVDIDPLRRLDEAEITKRFPVLAGRSVAVFEAGIPDGVEAVQATFQAKYVRQSSLLHWHWKSFHEQRYIRHSITFKSTQEEVDHFVFEPFMHLPDVKQVRPAPTRVSVVLEARNGCPAGSGWQLRWAFRN
jgi:transcriptional regulator with XRE-family HTH domain